mgnify:CR=1 FL=1
MSVIYILITISIIVAIFFLYAFINMAMVMGMVPVVVALWGLKDGGGPPASRTAPPIVLAAVAVGSAREPKTILSNLRFSHRHIKRVVRHG